MKKKLVVINDVIKYKVDPEKGIVVAYIDLDNEMKAFRIYCQIRECFNKVFDYGNDSPGINFADYIEKKLSGVKIVGKAKCHQEDNFSFEEGRKIARIRLIDKWQRFCNRIFNELIDRLNKGNAKLVNNLSRYIRNCDHGI